MNRDGIRLEGDILIRVTPNGTESRLNLAGSGLLRCDIAHGKATLEFARTEVLHPRIERWDRAGRLWIHFLVEDHGTRVGDDDESLVLADGKVVQIPTFIRWLASTHEGEFLILQSVFAYRGRNLFRFDSSGRKLWQVGARDFRPEDALQYVDFETSPSVNAWAHNWKAKINLQTGAFEGVLETNIK